MAFDAARIPVLNPTPNSILVRLPTGSPADPRNRTRVRDAAVQIRSWLGSHRTSAARVVPVATARRAASSLPAFAPVVQAARSRSRVAPVRKAMDVEAQWQRIAGLIEGVIRRGETAADLHRAAALRIDSTDYEIQLLKSDLAGILGHHCGVRA